MFRAKTFRWALWLLTGSTLLATTVIAVPRLRVLWTDKGMKIEKTNKRVGDPIVMAGLVLFPIYGEDGPGYDDAIDLDTGLERGTAEVREQPGAQVDTLVVENSGEVPIVVLAGTVLKGGKQDRQIGQDFVIAPKTTVEVDAFCVEQGRWNAEREGAATGGIFKKTDVIATSKVRGAAQYAESQGEVWEKVAEVNLGNAQDAPSGTLMATYDAEDVARKRDLLVGDMKGHLDAAQKADNVVGIAYAVDGKVLGARWFVNHHLFGLYRDKLLKTAAMEAINAKAVDKKPVPAVAVSEFVQKMRTAKPTKRKATKALNHNVYRESEEGTSSAADVDGVEVTADFLMH